MSDRQKRTAGASKKESRLAAIKAMRNKKGGDFQADDSSSDDERIYDEVTAEEYDALARRRVKEDDFVVDDDGSGYVDNGEDEWGKRQDYGSDEEEEMSGDEKGKRKKGKGGKDKSSKKVKPEHQIGALFANQAKKPPAPARERTVKPTKDDDNLMNDIFADLDSADLSKDAPSLSHSSSAAKQSNYSYKAAAARMKPMLSSAPKRDTKRLEEMAMFGKTGEGRKEEKKEETMDLDAAPAFDDPTDFGGNDLADDMPAEPAEPTDAAEGSTILADLQTRTVSTSKAGSTKSASAFLPQFAAPAAPLTASVVKASANTNAADWHSIRDQMSAGETTVEASTAAPALAENVLESDGSMRFFFLDAYEVKEKGEVYLFGKVLDRASGRYISCCVLVQNMQRKLFVLPRPRKLDGTSETDIEVEMRMVYEEVDNVRSKRGIRSFRSRTVEKRYAFEVAGVPAESEYLEVAYPFTDPELPADLSGSTFSHVFGTRTSPLELFLLEREIRGPSWLIIKSPQFTNRPMSWCKLELSVEKALHISNEPDDGRPAAAPPLAVMCLSLKTFMNHVKGGNEIAVVSAVIYPNLDIDDPRADAGAEHARFTCVRKLDAMPYPQGFAELAGQQSQKIEVAMNERALLSFLMTQIQRFDPDIIVSHNFIGFDLDVLLHRMKQHKIDNWSRIGRLRRTQWPKLQAGAGGAGESTYAEKQVVSGRLICDTWLAAREHIRAKSYSLTNLALSLLKTSREEVDFETIPRYFHRAGDLLTLIRHTETDAYLASMIMFKIQILPLSKQITNLAGNLWSRTLIGGRAERNEMLLLHEFFKLNYIVPDKSQAFGGPKRGGAGTAQAKGGDDDDDDEPNQPADTGRRPGQTGRRKPAYAGGLVLEPKKGLYDKYVLLLDFNSLYPSIIQEYNVDFTTVTRGTDAGDEEQMPDVPDANLPQGVLPKLLKTLVERRRQVKALMKGNVSEAEMGQYDIRQKALKLTANSMYGCLGFTHSRFYCKPLAMLITSKGREILQSTVDLAETAKLEVIYGDTDSIMIYTNTDDLNEVKRMGNEFKKLVNQRYKLLEIEVDGFYRRMLLLKKKKYAALIVTESKGQLETNVESKGLDMVRRDWCGLSQDVSAFVLDQILSSDDTAGKEEIVEKIHAYLRKVGEETRAGLIPIEKMVINKSLTKNVKDYNDAKTQPHVQVAIRMEARGQAPRVNDTIPYVVCVAKEGGPKDNSIANRAYHPDEVMKEDSGLVIDYEWYLQNQIVGPVQRLCDPIEGTDSGRIADCLGLDSARYKQAQAYAQFEQEEVKTLDSQISDEERFRDVERWAPKCIRCQHSAEFELLRRTTNDVMPTCGLFCPNEDCKQLMPTGSLYNQLMTACRSHVDKYQASWLICDDISCANRTRSMSVYGKRCLARGCKGVMKLEYTDTKLFTQLSYYESLVDVERLGVKLEGKDDRDVQLAVTTRYRESLSELKRAVGSFLSKNARNYVDLQDLFVTLSLVGLKTKFQAALTA